MISAFYGSISYYKRKTSEKTQYHEYFSVPAGQEEHFSGRNPQKK